MTFPNSGFTDASLTPLPGARVLGATGASGGAPVAVPGGPPGILGQLVALPRPEDQPIPSAQIFDTFATAVSNAVQTNVALPGCTVQIPAGFVGRLQSAVFYCANLLTTSDVRFTVLGNGAPLQGLNKVRLAPASVALAIANLEVFIRLPQQYTLTVTFDNNDGGVYNISAALYGWFWGEAQGLQYWQRGQTP